MFFVCIILVRWKLQANYHKERFKIEFVYLSKMDFHYTFYTYISYRAQLINIYRMLNAR